VAIVSQHHRQISPSSCTDLLAELAGTMRAAVEMAVEQERAAEHLGP
jgi:hypothetical protein